MEKDCLISYAGNKYSVPAEYVGKDVAVIVLENMLAAYFQGKQSFEVENTLLHQKGIVDVPPPKHSLLPYDVLMGGVIL